MTDPVQMLEGELDNLNRKGLAMLKHILVAFLVSLGRPLATLTEALCRTDFGERYFAPWNVLGGTFLLSVSVAPYIAFKTTWFCSLLFISPVPWRLSDLLSILFGGCWLVLFLYQSRIHFQRIRQRVASGVLWHSYCYGHSDMSPKRQAAYAMGLGIVLIIFHIYGPGILMFASGFVSLQMRAVETALLYQRVLDTIDAQLEQENLQDAILKKRNLPATSGYAAVLPAYVSTQHREKFLQRALSGPRSVPAPAAAPVAIPALEHVPPGGALAQSPSLPATLPPDILRSALTLALQRIRTLPVKAKIGGAALVLMLLLAWGAWSYYGYLNRIPRNAEVRVAVERALPTPSARLLSVSTKVLSAAGGDTATLQFSATMETVEPLYTQVAVSRYLSDMKADAGVFDRIQKIVTGPGGEQIKNDAGVTISTGSVADFVLLRENTKAHTQFTATGDIRAHRPVKAWEIQVANVHVDARPTGSPRSAFTGNVLFLDRPDDVQKLQATLADAQASLIKLEQAQKQHQEKLAQDEKTRQALLAKMAPGTLFNGTASQGTNTPQPLWLEITDLDQNGQTLKACLRNDGGWDDVRRFTGAFEIDTAKNLLLVFLKTDSSQLVQGGGPFIERNESYQFTLKLDGDSLTGSFDSWALQFARVPDDAQKQTQIALAKDNATKWLAATKAQSVYKVTASLPNQAWSEEYFFTFTKQDRGGVVMEGVLELPGTGLRRTFTGTLITNKYQADGKPLRLVTRGTDASKKASELSPLAFASDFSWFPQLNDDGHMRGDSSTGERPWHVEFAPSTAQELAKARTAPAPAPVPSVAGGATTKPQAVANAAVPAKAGAALPPFPDRLGFYILVDGKWVEVPQVAVVETPLPLAEVQAAMKLAPNAPARVGYVLLQSPSAPPVVTDRKPTIVARGVVPPLQGSTIYNHPTLPVIGVVPDGDKRWRCYQVVNPQTHQHQMENDMPIKVEDKATDTHLILPMQDLPPGFYNVRGAVFEIRDAKQK